MTDLRLEPLAMPGIVLGVDNPLPVFRGKEDDIPVSLDDSVPEEDRKWFGWRCATRVLPYRMRDNYSRNKRMRVFRAIILENDYLSCTFLPELGGRLTSLYHKGSKRELLDKNPVFQPANLALRNAWFSGGIEWNAGQLGHHYRTCDTIFAATVKGDGYPVLRLYEWDRVKLFTYQIDFHLPPDSEILAARVRIVNPTDTVIPMYWWTNVAVVEAEDVRCIYNATDALYNHSSGFGVAKLPELTGFDATYSSRSKWAREFFFRIPEAERHWMAALDAAGSGFFETSTDRLRGRKLFVWGTSRGGQRWQEYLAAPDRAYIEIQAGLARTQIEHVPMPAGAIWEFTEVFGLLKVDPAKVHSKNWPEAVEATSEAMERMLPRTEVDELHARYAPISDRSVDNILATGSGWGALEKMRLAISKKVDRLPNELEFPVCSISAAEAVWQHLLLHGWLPEREVDQDPGAYMVQEEWRSLLEKSVQTRNGDHWFAWYHLGVARMEARDDDGAEEAFWMSIKLAPSAWAYRCLSILKRREDSMEEVLDLLVKAWLTGPRCVPLAMEVGHALFDAKRYEEIESLMKDLDAASRNNERIRVLEARVAMQFGDFEKARRLIEGEFATIREGEVTLSDLWFEIEARSLAQRNGLEYNDDLLRRVRREMTPPRDIDFRMIVEENS